ncbi:unnamed protein product [Effrenium voratum]|nr:unnamed protein product [Effrenium voratum]
MLRLEAQLGEVPLRTPDWHSALNKLFGLQASAPHPPEGLELDDVAGYNNAMHACKQAGLWQRCLQLLGNMESKELQADAQTVATAMSACERGGHWQQAVSLLAAARERRLPESAAASNTVVNVCANNHQWQQALEVLSDMGLQRLRSAMTTRNSLLGACGRGSTWSAALAILVCQEVDAFGYNAVLTACVKSRQWQQGIQVFEAMDVPHDGISYELGVSACSKGVQWYQCLQLISTMKDIRLQPSAMTCSVALSMCQKFSRWQEALDLLEGDNVILNCKALSALSRGLQWQQAVALFSSMRERQAADQLTYTTLMGAFHKSSSWRQALALLQDLDAARLEVDEPLLHAAMCACEDAGQWQKAGTFCKGALAASATARRIQVLANKGQWHEALALLASAPSPRSALAVLAALRQAGAWQAAMALVTATAWGTQLTRAATAAMRTTAEANQMVKRETRYAFP